MNEIIQKAKEKQGAFQDKEPRAIAISDEIEISEDGAENEIATVYFKIPLSIRLCGRRDLTEYKRIRVEDLRTKAGTLFNLIEFFGDQLYAQIQIITQRRSANLFTFRAKSERV